MPLDPKLEAAAQAIAADQTLTDERSLRKAAAQHPDIRIGQGAMVADRVMEIRGLTKPPDDSNHSDLNILGGAAGLTAAMAVSRITQLVQGTSQIIMAVLDIEGLNQRLVAIPNIRTVKSVDKIVIYLHGEQFCSIVLTVNDQFSVITMSGLGLDQATNSVKNLVVEASKATSYGRIPTDLGSAIDSVVSSAFGAGVDLLTINRIAGVIDEYASEMEKVAAKTVREKREAEQARQAEARRQTNCTHCGAYRTLGQPCPNCRATE